MVTRSSPNAVLQKLLCLLGLHGEYSFVGSRQVRNGKRYRYYCACCQKEFSRRAEAAIPD